jgi:antirestriction protein ArdC
MANTEKLQAAHDRLAQSVETLSTSAGWTEYLEHVARFHNYSPRNVWMIMSQRDDASQVAGFKTWQSMGRQVRKGSKGIAILAPCVYKREDENGDAHKVLGGFRVAYVFDVSDTDGDPLPENPAKPILLDGEAPEGMFSYLVDELESRGFTLVLGEDPEHGENGYTQHATKIVRIVTSRSAASMVKTLAHELAHVILHADRSMDRSMIEVEAESVAFLVCDAFGLASDDYSFAYVTSWAGADHKKVLATAKRVQDCAREILAKLSVRELVPA